MEAIPIIDLGADKVTVLDGICAACEDVGFFQITGHGVPAATIDATYEVYDRLYALPDAVKQQWSGPVPFRGYGKPGSPFIEVYGVANIVSREDAASRGVPEHMLDYFDPFPWPDVAGFQEAVSAMLDETRGLAARLMSLFAEVLGLDPVHFAPMFVHDVSDFTCRSYTPGLHEPVLMGEHTDSGALTILHQRGSYDGLEVQLVTGDRVTVPRIEEAFVVNLGDLIARWTNDRFLATPHRVLTPPTPADWRKSVILFQQPAVDTLVAPLDACVGADGPHYDPVTPYEWQGRVKRIERPNYFAEVPG
jgi:isopenicillin N synthase-like dioxygenase